MSVLSFPTPSRRDRPGLVEAAAALFTGAVRAWRARQADRALEHLSDEMLHDIGISRSEIPDVTRHGRPIRR